MSLGLDMQDKKVLAVWRLAGEDTCELPLPEYQGKELQAKIAFPAEDQVCKVDWDTEKGVLRVTMPQEKMARIIEIRR